MSDTTGPRPTDEERETWREMAKAATPGPWEVRNDGDEFTEEYAVVAPPDGLPGSVYILEEATQGHADAAYIAHSSPDRVLALLDDLATLRAENQRLTVMLDITCRSKSPCGHWSAHAHATDEGKVGRTIECWQCRAEAAEASRDALQAERDDALADAQWKPVWEAEVAMRRMGEERAEAAEASRDALTAQVAALTEASRTAVRDWLNKRIGYHSAGMDANPYTSGNDGVHDAHELAWRILRDERAALPADAPQETP